jgi:hypothetical protein
MINLLLKEGRERDNEKLCSKANARGQLPIHLLTQQNMDIGMQNTDKVGKLEILITLHLLLEAHQQSAEAYSEKHSVIVTKLPCSTPTAHHAVLTAQHHITVHISLCTGVGSDILAFNTTHQADVIITTNDPHLLQFLQTAFPSALHAGDMHNLTPYLTRIIDNIRGTHHRAIDILITSQTECQDVSRIRKMQQSKGFMGPKSSTLWTAHTIINDIQSHMTTEDRLNVFMEQVKLHDNEHILATTLFTIPHLSLQGTAPYRACRVRTYAMTWGQHIPESLKLDIPNMIYQDNFRPILLCEQHWHHFTLLKASGTNEHDTPFHSTYQYHYSNLLYRETLTVEQAKQLFHDVTGHQTHTLPPPAIDRVIHHQV